MDKLKNQIQNESSTDSDLYDSAYHSLNSIEENLVETTRGEAPVDINSEQTGQPARIHDVVEIVQLPKLHIEHNRVSCRLLRLYHLGSVFVALCCAIIAVMPLIGIFYYAFGVNRHNPIFFVGIILWYVLILPACFHLIAKTFLKLTSYFKEHFLRSELEAFCEILSFMNAGINIDKPDYDVRCNYMECSSVGNLVKSLNFGGDAWNKGDIKDDIKGKYFGLKFRFIDMVLAKVIGAGRNQKIDPIFGGQVFIFNTHLNLTTPVQYNYYTGQACNKRTDFETAFAISNYSKTNNPFERTPSESERASALSRYANGNLVDTDKLLTNNFIDNLLRLGQRMTNAQWGIRLDENYLILIISRYEDFFEMNKLSPKKTIDKLDKDMQEFVDILGIVSQMDIVEK